MIQFLKKRNRTLLELWSGMLILGIICVIPGIIFANSGLIYVLSLILGMAMAMASSVHMYKSLDKALDLEEAAAKKKIMLSYYIRYGVVVLLFAVICVTQVLYPLVVFLGYMTLKFGALMQPKIHKLYNRIFHETDPVPEPMIEEDTRKEVEQ